MTARPTRSFLFACAALVAVAPGADASQMRRYSIVDLGALPGQSQSIATGINDKGQVVGFSYSTRYDRSTSTGAWQDSGNRLPLRQAYDEGVRSFRYEDGSLVEINPRGGPANAINNAGLVVGGRYTSINNEGRYVGGAGMYLNGEDVGGLVVGQGDSESPIDIVPYAIGEQGRVVGVRLYSTGEYRAATWEGGSASLLPDVQSGSSSWAVDINRSGQVIINARPVGSADIRSYLVGVGDDETSIRDLTGLSDGDFAALAINDLGQVVGAGYFFDGTEALKLEGLIGSQAGWTSLAGVDINNLGQIVGQGVIDGKHRAFLMTPMSVPEPTPLVVLMSGLCGAVWWRARGKQ